MSGTEHSAASGSPIGVLLINLGTPDDASPAAIRRYLTEFLSDRRVVEIPPLFWQPILRGIVLNTRPRKSAHAYRQIWTEAGSPLAVITRAQAAALAGRLGHGVQIDFAMRYGRPSIGERLTAMKAAGCERILLAPLYPQYCSATTATAVDAAGAALSRMRWQPAIRTLPPYHDDRAYIEALRQSIQADLSAHDFEPQAIIASFHGMPQRTSELGDPYQSHCRTTAHLLSEALDRPVRISFQSRFGRARWLEPATEAMLASLPDEGIRSVAVVAPGFAADCLETLEEIAIRGRRTFLDAGGDRFLYVNCLNDSAAGVEMLYGIVRRELAGWLSPQ